MRKITFVFIVLFLALTTPLAVNAQRQQNVHFQHVQIDLWPEFDRPSMLVIYRAVLAEDVSLPADITFRIPASAGEPHAVAFVNEDGISLNADYERQVLDEWAYINLTTNYTEVLLEYYDPGIVRENKLRTFTYQWLGDYAVDNIVMLVQQPPESTNMSTMPRLTNVVTDSKGQVYLQGEIGAFAQGETFSMTVSYEKETDALTVSYLEIDSSAPVTTATPGRMSVDTALPYAMAILGVVVIIIAIFWYWATGRQKVQPRRRPEKSSRRKTTRVVEPEMHDHNPYEQSTFCHECGKRANSGDKFCRSCGSKLRL